MDDKPIALPDFTRGTVHLFDRDTLDAMVERTLPDMPAGKDLMVGFGADTNGAAVAVIFHKDQGAGSWEARAAFGYTRREGFTGSVGGSFSR